MTDEIKETLEDIKRHLDYVELVKQSSIRDKEIKVMYDYITKLQEENNQYKEYIKELKDSLMNYHIKNNKLIIYKSRNEKATEYIENIEEDKDIDGLFVKKKEKSFLNFLKIKKDLLKIFKGGE